MKREYVTKLKLPDSPGVYFFKKGSKILYIGKATSLRDRVKSYFATDLIKTRGVLLVDMVGLATKLTHIKTDSVLEALLLESQLIKEHLPYYNTKEKDNKSFNYVVITNEDFPQLLTVRGRNLEKEREAAVQNEDGADVDLDRYKYIFGPYVHGGELRQALKLIRKIFPYRDERCTPLQIRPCFNRTIGLCPGVCTGEISQKEYARQIQHIRLFFQGRKKDLVKTLQKELKVHIKEMEFERAGEIQRELYSLKHIQDVSMLTSDRDEIAGQTDPNAKPFRMEAYDVAHLSGKDMVGVMVVMQDGEFNKNEYRKFIIKTVDKSNDTGALKEMLERRLTHTEWTLPDVVIVDGGQPQRDVATKAFTQLMEHYKDVADDSLIPPTMPIILSVLKDDKHKAKEIIGECELFAHLEKSGQGKMLTTQKKKIVNLNIEAHRYAIAFHKKRRKNAFL